MGNDKPTITRRRLMQGAAAAFAAPAIIGRAYAEKTVKLGFISPETGPIAAFGSADAFILGEIRKAIAGGVEIGDKKLQVEILVRDSQSNPSRAAELAAELITKDKVDLMLASSTSDTTLPVADQCELNGVPCLSTDTPWEPWFFGRGATPDKGFENTYHFFWGGGQVVQTFTGLWNSIQTNKQIGGVWSNDPDGVALSNMERGLPAGFIKAGYKYTDMGLFTPLSNDFSAQIAKLKAANCDIVTGVFLPPDFATFWAQCGQQGYKPKAVTIAKALLFPASIEALGDRGVGLSSEEWWSPNHPFKSGLTGQSAAELCAAFTKATGKQWSMTLGFRHALFETAIDALKRAKKIDDAGSIRDAIAKTDLNTIVGPVNFSKGPYPNCSETPLVIGQWQKGKKFPFDLINVDNSTTPAIPVGGKMAPIANG